jgi:hypothetical protein
MLSSVCPVTSLTVNPSRAWVPNATPTAACPDTGPDTVARIARSRWLPSGASMRLVHCVIDGRPLAMFTTPPSVLRPKSALSGPRTNSICSTSSSSMFDELAFS